MNAPEWTKLWTLDEAAECLSLSDETYKLLWNNLASVPDTDKVKHDHSEYPEDPDCGCKQWRMIATWWDRLPVAVQAEIMSAFEKKMTEVYGDH